MQNIQSQRLLEFGVASFATPDTVPPHVQIFASEFPLAKFVHLANSTMETSGILAIAPATLLRFNSMFPIHQGSRSSRITMVSYRDGKCTFKFRCDETERLYLAGDFNGWLPHSTPMAEISPGIWRLKLKLAPGKQRFRYVTANGEWLTDYAAPIIVLNPYQEWDSVIEVPGEPVISEFQELHKSPPSVSPIKHAHDYTGV